MEEGLFYRKMDREYKRITDFAEFEKTRIGETAYVVSATPVGYCLLEGKVVSKLIDENMARIKLKEVKIIKQLETRIVSSPWCLEYSEEERAAPDVVGLQEQQCFATPDYVKAHQHFKKLENEYLEKIIEELSIMREEAEDKIGHYKRLKEATVKQYDEQIQSSVNLAIEVGNLRDSLTEKGLPTVLWNWYPLDTMHGFQLSGVCEGHPTIKDFERVRTTFIQEITKESETEIRVRTKNTEYILQKKEFQPFQNNQTYEYFVSSLKRYLSENK